MTGEASKPLTDGQLEMLEWVVDSPHISYQHVTTQIAPRLIAEVKRLKNALARMTAERDHWQRMYEVAKARADKAEGLPSGNTEGETCQGCGHHYLTVYRLPDEVWNRISPKPGGGGLLCPSCADERARHQGIELYWGAALDKYPSHTERPQAPVYGNDSTRGD